MERRVVVKARTIKEAVAAGEVELKKDSSELEWKVIAFKMFPQEVTVEIFEKREWDIEFEILPDNNVVMKLVGGALSFMELREVINLRKLPFTDKYIKELHKILLMERKVLLGSLEELKVESLDSTFSFRDLERAVALEISLTAPRGFGKKPTLKKILKALESRKVKNDYIDEIGIKRLIKEGEGKAIIAVGKAPVKGKDGSITWFVSEPTYKPKILEDGRVDFKSIDFFRNVKAGQEILEVERSIPGKPGENIYGQEVLPPPVKEVKVLTGKNVFWDGNKLKAEKSGYLVIEPHGKVEIREVIELDEVGLETGNIEFDGLVKVRGDIKAGYIVKAGVGIEVAGTVEEAKLYSDGHVYIKGGFLGGESGEIVAKGAVKAKFVNGGKITAGKNVIIDSYAVNCEINSDASIYCVGDKGVIAATAFALYSIVAREFGSKLGVKTRIEVGFLPSYKKKKEELMDRWDKLKKTIEAVKMKMDVLVIKIREGKATDKEKEEFVKIKKAWDALLVEQANLKKELGETLKILYETSVVSHPECRIEVLKVAHLNTFFRIGDYPYAVTRVPLTTSALVVRDDEVRIAEPLFNPKKLIV